MNSGSDLLQTGDSESISSYISTQSFITLTERLDNDNTHRINHSGPALVFSHASGYGMAVLLLGCTVMKLCTSVHDPQRMLPLTVVITFHLP